MRGIIFALRRSRGKYVVARAEKDIRRARYWRAEYWRLNKYRKMIYR